MLIGGKNKETAWSGTNYSLYKALTKYYDVHDINLKGNRWANAFLSKVLRIDGASIEYYQRHLLKKNLKDILNWISLSLIRGYQPLMI